MWVKFEWNKSFQVDSSGKYVTLSVHRTMVQTVGDSPASSEKLIVP